MSALLIGGLLTGVGAAAKGAVSGVRSRKERKALEAQAKQMEQLANTMQQAVIDGKMTLDDVLGRLDAHVNKVGGQLKQWYDNQMQLGTEMINNQLGQALDQVKFNLNEAKITADRQERRLIEQEEKQLKRVSEDFEKSNQKIMDDARRHRLSGSSALRAAMGKSQETLGKINEQIRQSSSEAFRAIGQQFSDVARAAGFQTTQAQAQAGQATLGLQAQAGGQLAQGQMRLAEQEFAGRENAYQRALQQKQNIEAIRQRGRGFEIQSEAISPLSGVFSGIAGGLTGIGSELFSAGLAKPPGGGLSKLSNVSGNPVATSFLAGALKNIPKR